jgi:hypothetical protein
MKATIETTKWQTGRASSARRPAPPAKWFRKYEFRGVTFLVTSGELAQTMRDVRRLYNEITRDFYQRLERDRVTTVSRNGSGDRSGR